MNIKEIKASKAQGHKRAEDAKNNNRKVNKETKKRGAFKAIYWWSLAGCWGTPGPFRHRPFSWPSISLFPYLFFFLTVKLPSLFSDYKCLLFLLLLWPHSSPSLWDPSTSWASAPSPFMGPRALPPTQLCLPLASSLGACVPFSWWTGWRFQWLQSRLPGTPVNIRSHQSLRFQLTGREVSPLCT